jgi:acetate kinase
MAAKNLQLVLNLGSSSIKYGIFRTSVAAGKPTWDLLVDGLAEGIGTNTKNRIKQETENGKEVHEMELPDHKFALQTVIGLLSDEHAAAIGSIGHRVVHGGEAFSDAALIDSNVIDSIKEASSLAPLHNPWNLLGIEMATDIFGADTPNVAVFDTAFHQTIPEHAYLYGLPYEMYEKHAIRRYGFHGTSYLYVSRELARVMGKPVEDLNMIVCHIGNGASMSAIKGGKSIDTSMGLTPLEGLVMGTRCGDIDPAIVLHLMDNLGYTSAEVNDLMNKQSGFLGLCGTMHDLEVENGFFDGDAVMTRTKKVQIHRMRKYLGSYMVALDGKVDALVFAGGLGEKSHLLRTLVCENLADMGFDINEERNQSDCDGRAGVFDTNQLCSADGSKSQVWVIPTNEELSIAQQTYNLVNQE